jgi:hypothetical protein
MAVFGIVMMLKPVVPLSPVTVKDTVVELEDRVVNIVTLEIWDIVTFPLIARSTVLPLSVFALTVVSNGVEEGDGVAVGVGVLVGFDVGVVVEVGVGLGVDIEVGSGVGEAVGVGEGVGEAVGVGEGVGEAVGVGEGVGEAVGVGEGVGEREFTVRVAALLVTVL